MTVTEKNIDADAGIMVGIGNDITAVAEITDSCINNLIAAILRVYGDNVFEKCGINRDGAGEVGKPRYFNGKRHF